MTLTYFFDSSFFDRTAPEQWRDARECIKAALGVWAQAIGATLVFGCEGGHVIRFGCASTLPEVGKVGWCSGPLTLSDAVKITFNDSVRWQTRTPGWASYLPRLFSRSNDLFTVALHEIGHALGLAHVDPDDDDALMSCMNASPEVAGLVNKPSNLDIALAKKALGLI